MNKVWERCVPVFDTPIFTRSLFALCAMGALGCVLALYREAVGLGPASGMSDAYAWGIWKTFNIMVLTGLGSGGFSIGIAAWLFRRHRLHSVLRTAVLVSFLTYVSGLMLLGIDVGRPWNFFWILLPWRWNVHSPMLEIAFCMPLYTAVPLLFENIPAGLDGVLLRWPQWKGLIDRAEGLIKRIYPLMLGLAFLLPAMHQSSLGALMLLAGQQVHPLWQTPWLPLLYVWAASFMGFAFVGFVLQVCHLIWDRPIDNEALAEMSRIAAWLILAWLGFRLLDLGLRGSLRLAFAATAPSVLFWVEVALLLTAGILLFRAGKSQNLRLAFQGNILAALGGMLYRFDPTTLVYRSGTASFYFPSAIELLIGIGFVSLAIAAFSILAKILPILPAPTKLWYAMESARWEASFEIPDDACSTRFAAAD